MREIRQISRRRAGIQGRSSRNTRYLHGLLALVMVGAATAGCGSGGGQQAASPSARESAGSPTVVVAAVPAPGAAALYLAEQRGFFSRAGLHVRIESSVSASKVLPDLVNGSVSVALGQWTSALAAAAAGVKLTVIAPGNSGGPGLEEIVTFPGSGITRLSQLRGKVVAVNALAGLPQALTDSVLAAHGITASAVRFVPVPFPDMATALAAHRVAAAFMVSPYLEEAGKVRVLADIDAVPVIRGIPVTGYYASQAWAAAHAAQLAAFGKALAQGQRIAVSDPAAARRAIVAYTGVSAKVAAAMPLGTYPASVSAADLSRVGTLMQRYGLLRASANVGALARGMTS
ncbi:MAG: ABC transporter substrate-binding protein [Trebonia sp.]